MAPLFLLAAATNAFAGASDLDLVEIIGSSSGYAPYQFECQGYSKRRSRVEAGIALGRNFDDRVRDVLAKRFAKYGSAAVEAGRIIVLPGVRLSSQRCQEFKNVVQQARSALAELEARYGE